MIRGMTILWTALALCVGVGLFLLKYEVQTLEDKLTGLNRDIRHHQESIHILKAEWSYLNDPERLRELNERHLSLKAFRPDQIMAVADLPMAPPKSTEPQEIAPPAAEPPSGRTLVDAPQPAKPALAPKPATRTVEAKAVAPAPPPVLKAPEPPKAPLRPAEAKPVVVAVTKPAAAAPRPAQTLPTMPVSAGPQMLTQPTTVQPQANVLVIKSPALLEAERGRR